MDRLIDLLATNPDLGLSSIFLALFLIVMYQTRKDHKDLLSDHRSMFDRLLEVVEENTKSNTMLHEIIKDLRDEFRNNSKR